MKSHRIFCITKGCMERCIPGEEYCDGCHRKLVAMLRSSTVKNSKIIPIAKAKKGARS